MNLWPILFKLVDTFSEHFKYFIVFYFLLDFLLLTRLRHCEVKVDIIVVNLHDVISTVLVNSLLIDGDQLFIPSNLTVVKLRNYFDQLSLVEGAIVFENTL